jgi:hypothetical protein
MHHLRLLFITNDIDIAAFAVESGVDRVFVDLEILGKVERQGKLDTVISRHGLADLTRLRPCVPPGSLLVRINPVHAGTAEEVEQVIAAGADTVMLPMFRGPAEVETAARAIAGRARLNLLVETVGAMQSLHECVRVAGVDEVHIGLNDLHLELGQRFMFQPLADGLVDRMAHVLHEARMPFGVGGVARVGEGLLPAELLLAEHVRLGSTAVILSRTFHRRAASVAEIQSQMDFGLEVRKLREAYAGHLSASATALDAMRAEMQDKVRTIAAGLPPRTAT